MQEMEVSESEARDYVMKLIDTSWKQMNKYLVNGSTFDQSFVWMAYNLARTTHFMTRMEMRMELRTTDRGTVCTH